MKNTGKYLSIFSILWAMGLCLGCGDFLEERPNKSMVIPLTASDLQSLLDNTDQMNLSPALGIVGAGDFYTTDNGWTGYRSVVEQNAYLWREEIFEGEYAGDWISPYRQAFIANVVLERAGELLEEEGPSDRLEEIRASALFFRGFAHYQLLQLFAPPYQSATAGEDLGVPLKLNADIHERVSRASLEDAYRQVEADLLASAEGLPERVAFKSRPSLYAAYGMLSRLYLHLGDYGKAENYADLALRGGSELMDYGPIDAGAAYPFEKYNPEVVFHCDALNYSYATSTMSFIDPLLLDSYAEGDRRRALYFTERTGGSTFRGQYSGNYLLFSGIARDELMLNLAETLVRNDKLGEGMEVLNGLLATRFEEGAFVPLEAENPDEALQLVVTERRKTLLFRGINWSDLRRYNLEEGLKRDLKRELDGVEYTLPAGDKRYVLPIPVQELDFNELEQNPR